MDSKTVQRSALCRSRRELSNEYLLAKFGFDTAGTSFLKFARSPRTDYYYYYYRSPRYDECFPGAFSTAPSRKEIKLAIAASADDDEKAGGKKKRKGKDKADKDLTGALGERDRKAMKGEGGKMGEEAQLRAIERKMNEMKDGGSFADMERRAGGGNKASAPRFM